MRTQIKLFLKGAIRGILYALVLYLFLMSTYQATFPVNYYEVYVQYRAGGCTETKKIVIQAQSTNEAKARAQKIVQFGIETRIIKLRELE